MKCKTCLEEKPVADFHKSKNTTSGYRGSCKVCTNKKNADWYDRNKDTLRPARKEYAQQNREAATERMRRWRAENPERAKEMARQRYLARREELLQKARERHASKPGYSGWKGSRRRARIKKSGGSFTHAELVTLYHQYDDKCINPDCETPDALLTPDHVVPLAKGGTNNIDNIQPLCFPCNLRKGTTIIDYRALRALNAEV